MKTWKTLWATGLILFFGAQAQADLNIDPAIDTAEQDGESAECQADPDCYGKSGTKFILDFLAGLGYDVSNELYKDNVGEGDSGMFAGNYTTTYYNTPDDPMDATISYDGTGKDMEEAQWLLVKDGSQTPIWYLYDISGWDGQMDINLLNFWPAMGAISHVSIYGGVPEPGTLALFGVALAGFGLARRRKAAKA